jgi:hypothetical protein
MIFLLQVDAVNQAEIFIEEVAKLSEQLLLEFDSLLTIDDVEKGSKSGSQWCSSRALIDLMIESLWV